MKVRVIRDFYDKANDEVLRKAGDEMVISQERYDEILSVGDFVEEIKEESKEETKKSTKKKVGADNGAKG